MRFFISYRHGNPDEEALASFLAESLNTAGHEVFIDTAIRVGTDWVREIDERVAWCDYLIALLSKESSGSEMVQTELRKARQLWRANGQPSILPVRVNFFETLDYELDAYIGRIQYASWRRPADSQRVLEELLAVARGEGPTGTGASLHPPASLPAASRPMPSFDARTITAPGGTIAADDPLYVSRSSDDVICEVAKRLTGQTVVIRGPRQTGKSSLVARYLSACAASGKLVAFLDFSLFESAELDDYPALLSSLALFLLETLQLSYTEEPQIAKHQRMISFMQKEILARVTQDVVLAIDEADCIVGKKYQTDFFSLLRLFHNNRASINFGQLWKRLHLAIVISTEPRLLIKDRRQSPFNVVDPLMLESFNLNECAELNERYGGFLSPKQVEKLHQLLGGHPYLTRLAYYRMTTGGGMPFETLVEKAVDHRGPFGDHLRATLALVLSAPGLLEGMRQVITHKKADGDLFHRLHAIGLVRASDNEVLPASKLYEDFFRVASE
jgi:hypothetical protein